jgi:hypothetical protein
MSGPTHLKVRCQVRFSRSILFGTLPKISAHRAPGGSGRRRVLLRSVWRSASRPRLFIDAGVHGLPPGGHGRLAQDTVDVACAEDAARVRDQLDALPLEQGDDGRHGSAAACPGEPLAAARWSAGGGSALISPLNHGAAPRWRGTFAWL